MYIGIGGLILLIILLVIRLARAGRLRVNLDAPVVEVDDPVADDVAAGVDAGLVTLVAQQAARRLPRPSRVIRR